MHQRYRTLLSGFLSDLFRIQKGSECFDGLPVRGPLPLHLFQ